MYKECGYSDDPIHPGYLNCPYNGPAVNISTFQNPITFRTTLINYCGPRWEGVEAVCCDQDILDTIIESVAISEQFVAGCPACWYNMKAIWCEHSCNPDQSLFANVTQIGPDPAGSGNQVVLATQYYVSEAFGTTFYESCNETKYGASNTLAMTFIGGGATNYQELLVYLGTPKVMGSPFPIEFPFTDIPAEVVPMDASGKPCDDPVYNCSCVDCTKMCPLLAPIPEEREPCMVGSIRCLSFGLIIGYVICAVLAVVLYLVTCRKHGDDEDMYAPLHSGSTSEWALYSGLQRGYYRLGFIVGRYPLTVVSIGSVLVAACCVGLMNFQVETDPIQLWVGPDSASNQDKVFFDTNFGPFYRTEQIIFSNVAGGNIMREETVARLFDIENGVAALETIFNGSTVTLDVLCFKPLGDFCATQSVTGFWQANKTAFTTDPNWYDHMLNCLGNPSFPGDSTELECLPPFQDPLKAEIVLGGFNGTIYANATAFVVTFVVNNYLDENLIDRAVAWEKEYIAYMMAVAVDPVNADLRITFFSESAIELELARESKSDLVIIAISYLVMFLYASFALGKFVSFRRFFIDSKFTLGIAGVLICVFSVLVAVGLFSAFGVKTSLIIAEVIPFLVLAVGVDNIFILVHCFGRFDRAIPPEERSAMALSEVGPSITLCALSETVAFALGGIVSMPAVYNFAAFSAVAVFTDFLLQVTVFVALLTLDARRVESNRLDCFPCVSVKAEEPPEYEEGFLDRFVSKHYAPFLMRPYVKIVVILFFLALFFVALGAIPYIELGLDQKIALPHDSYLIPYFDDQTSLLKVGVPVYFVISGVNVSTFEGQQSMCSSFRDCDPYSISNILVLESNRPEYSTLALSPALWLDDYVRWLNPSLANCCRVRTLDPDTFCQYNDTARCSTCYRRPEYTAFDIGPIGEDFMTHLDFFLQAVPGAECALAGKAAYSTAIVPDYDLVTVNASYFRTYHTVLKTQEDFINAYESALRICDDIMIDYPEAQCFPYAITYVYFEQYRTIVPVSVFLVVIASIAVFLVNWLILGSFFAALCVIIPVLLIVIDLAGVMAIWVISLNAVSLVNLVMGLGISVEFCSHLTRAFRINEGTRNERAVKALEQIGSSIFSGITITKFFGVIVLAFANSEIFVVYYFRMYLTIVFLGFGHGLILLPVLLSYIGPSSVKAVHFDSNTINASYSEVLSQEDARVKELRKQDQRNALYGSIS